MGNNRSSHKYNLRFQINRTRMGRAIKLSKARKVNGKQTEPFKASGIVIDGITTEDELRRGIKVQMDYILDEIVEHFKQQLEGAKEDVVQTRIKERAYNEKVKARKEQTLMKVDR